MGLMDRVKAQANQLAQMTQDAAQEGRNRIDQAQAARRGDALLRQLGAAVFADRTGRGTPDSQAKIEQLIGEISAAGRPPANWAARREPTGQPVLWSGGFHLSARWQRFRCWSGVPAAWRWPGRRHRVPTTGYAVLPAARRRRPRVGRYRRRLRAAQVGRIGIARQAEYPLADDVELDVGGAAANR
jgi:hypothetical protein